MSRLLYLRYDDLDDDGQLVWDSVTGTRLIGPFNAFVHAPDIGRHLIHDYHDADTGVLAATLAGRAPGYPWPAGTSSRRTASEPGPAATLTCSSTGTTAARSTTPSTRSPGHSEPAAGR